MIVFMNDLADFGCICCFSGLKDIARQIGQIGPEADAVVSIQNIVDNLKLHEAWDLLECMKNLLSDERRANRVKEVLEQQPQLIAAMYEIQVEVFLLFYGLRLSK